MSRKYALLGSIFLTSTLFMSGCDISQTMTKTRETMENKIASISVPYEWFRNKPEQTNQKVISKVVGIDLAQEEVQLDELSALSKRIEAISTHLQDKEDFQAISKEKKSVFNILGSEYLDLEYDDTQDGLKKTIQEIGKVPHQWIGSLTLRKYGVQLNEKGERQRVAIVDANAVNDTEKFHIQTIRLALNEKGLIQSSTQLGKPVDKPHTGTPLTSESLLYPDTHLEFQRQIKNVIKALSNPTIYSQIQSQSITSTDTSIKALAKEIGVEPQNESTVFKLVKEGKGTFESWGITGYLFDDKNVTGKTLYELTVADQAGLHVYTVTFDRGLKKITNISTGSPFLDR